ncbi:MAG: hypothetical protein R3190_19500 [Thermoanaerobaculia bacterium]|nr:hypothetical protein [Thermoanaerobaculia bacterium]
MAIKTKVKIDNKVFEYVDRDSEVDAAGNVWVTKKKQGTVNIRWKRAKGETWKFVDPYITFQNDGAGDLKKLDTSEDRIRVQDKNSVLNTNIKYTLYTDAGNHDPLIVNRNGG